MYTRATWLDEWYLEELQSNDGLALIKCGEARERPSGPERQGVVEIVPRPSTIGHQESISPRRRHWTETVRISLSRPPLHQSLAHIRTMERSSHRVIHAYAHVRTNQVLYSFTPYIHVSFPVRQFPPLTPC